MAKPITKVFHGGRFKQIAAGKSKSVAEQEKERIQNSGHSARVTASIGRDRSKTYQVWKK